MSKQQRHLYEFGPFSLDMTDRFLLRDGQPVSLPPKALETLIVLVQNQGRLVEKDELMKTLWPDSYVEEANLNHHVWALRKTLGETSGGDRYIETVPRRGYRFIAGVTEVPDADDELVVEKHSFTRIVTEKAEDKEIVVIGDSKTGTRSIEAISTPAATTGAISSTEYVVNNIKRHKRAALMVLSVVVIAAAAFAYLKYFGSRPQKINSIAVLPFVNTSNDPNMEYLSDGIGESLINSLSQLPQLKVIARSSSFKYKGKEVDPQEVARALGVQAILNGRLVQRGDYLTLYLSLVDAQTGNQIWGEQYNRKLTDLVSLQSEIARDVSQKLRARLSGVDEQKLAKNYTENAEAYQLYLKGRYHVLKMKRPETQKALSYFQQAIAIDQNYAPAYVGLANAYRALTLTGDLPATEFLPKAKAAAQKAIEIDDTLADAHAHLAYIMFWFDWDWDAAEKQCKRALELNPDSAEAHDAYAHVLSSTRRHAEALAEIRRAIQLDPLNLRINVLEAQFLIHAGQADEALARLQKTFELDANFWFTHLLASSAYIEKGMFAEAITEARRAKELSDVQTLSVAFEGYALAKSGKRDEARALLDGLLKLSKERFVPSYHIALLCNGLGKRDEAIAWLERGYVERDPKMTFLKVEPKWNNLRDDPHFQDLLRRVGLPQ